ncbi:MAG: hypothetical protein K2W85_08220 [Phycisphaerales bacterium]|nr:hypothetical protein [Phycisphaerales bacterium]
MKRTNPLAAGTHIAGPRNAGLMGIAAALLAASGALAQPLPPVPVPPENPITEPKRILGKILFFDEQLSHDNTVSCATCHVMNRAGSDPRRARNPGPDGVLNTPDDKIASPGVIASSSVRDIVRDAIFGTAPQITGRTANSPINAAFAPNLFWDGRAGGEFRDPDTNQVLIVAGGALENQAIQPPLSDVEMGHDQIAWSTLTTKLTGARPLALSTNLPTDVATRLASRPGYSELFQAAFGDSNISAARIAFALATYQRTLIANQTPFDLGTLTPQQQQGLQRLQANNCTVCHGGPLFTGNGFRNIGLRPIGEDNGRQGVTNLAVDAGRFKVPSLRNAGLKNTFMHNGQFTTLQQVFGFYDRAPGTQQFPQNQDPVMANVRIPPPDGAVVADLITNGLRDPRVANQTFPFDKPTLFTERAADRPTIVGGGRAGTGGVVPQIIAVDPPMLGNGQFRVAVDQGLAGATARLLISSSGPVNGIITPNEISSNKVITGLAGQTGVATLHMPLVGVPYVNGQIVFMQWQIDDAGAAGGQSYSTVASVRFFCGSMGCPSSCRADFNTDNTLNTNDLFGFLNAWFAADPRCDVDLSDTIEVGDVFAFLNLWFAGC